jgi:hypothetical protein
LPCQLLGTGMAFPWDVIYSADLGSGQIVEDLKLGLDLTLAGHPPVFCPSARVTSEFASSVKGASTQRKRWEQGHLDTILKTAPRLLTIAIARRDWNLLAIALDLAVPHYLCSRCWCSESLDSPCCIQYLAIHPQLLLSVRLASWFLRWPLSLHGSSAAAMWYRPAHFCKYHPTLFGSSHFIVNLSSAKSIHSGLELIGPNNDCIL